MRCVARARSQARSPYIPPSPHPAPPGRSTATFSPRNIRSLYIICNVTTTPPGQHRKIVKGRGVAHYSNNHNNGRTEYILYYYYYIEYNNNIILRVCVFVCVPQAFIDTYIYIYAYNDERILYYAGLWKLNLLAAAPRFPSPSPTPLRHRRRFRNLDNGWDATAAATAGTEPITQPTTTTTTLFTCPTRTQCYYAYYILLCDVRQSP